MSDRYEIREQVGKGGLGAVYKAFDTQLQREVAIKRVLSPDQASEEEVDAAAKNLIAEAQTLSSLNHPNIVTVFDVGQDKEGGFVVMELLKGETLDETVERGVLTQEDFTEVVYQTMEALIAAQASNVIHRDIKPTNIMVIWQASGKFQTKILDFGLAKFSKSPSVQTMDQDESVMGSIFFMAPEQFERGELDSRTDLYQMGCVYYNALTGQYPFNGETAPQVMNAHLQHKVVPLEQIRPDLPPSICQWVMWMINRDIDHRPKDARDALKHWPRNPEPPGAIPVEVLPVEETPKISSSNIKIVTGASQASAPPSLIVTKSTGGVGSTTGRLVTGTGSVAIADGSRSQRLRQTGPLTGGIDPNAGKNRSRMWIIIASSVSAVLIFVIMSAVNKSRVTKEKDRILELSSEESPTGTIEDVAICLKYLNDPKASRSVRSDALKILKRLEGPGIDEAILKELNEAESTSFRIRLSDILSEREYTPAVSSIIRAFKLATKDDQRVDLLNSVRGIADMKSIDEMLDALQADHNLTVRRVFEDTVLAVLRKSPNPDQVVDKILTRVSNTEGNERKSLFRILGVVGGDKVRNRLTSVYSKQNNVDYQRDAMIAYLSWQDRSVLPDVEEIIKTTKDKALRAAAERTYVRLAGLPGPSSIEDKVAVWQKSFNLINNPSDYRRLISSMIEYPSQKTVDLLNSWSGDPKYGKLAKGAAETLAKSIAGVPVIESNQALKGNMARVQGGNGAAINSFLESLTAWTSPETWFSWNFKVKEAGNYAVIVDQATQRKESSDFKVILSDKVLEGTSESTPSLEEFKPVELPGTVALEAGEIYTLVLVAGQRIQPRMMDIGAIRLVKK